MYERKNRWLQLRDQGNKFRDASVSKRLPIQFSSAVPLPMTLHSEGCNNAFQGEIVHWSCPNWNPWHDARHQCFNVMAHMFLSFHLCEWIPSLSLPGVSLAHCPPATCISRPAIIVGMGSSVSSVARSVLAINLINLFPTTAAQTDRSGKNVVTSK